MNAPLPADQKLTFEQLERFGKLADKCDNFLAGTVLAMPAEFHLRMLKGALEDISKELKACYVEFSGGENPWA